MRALGVLAFFGVATAWTLWPLARHATTHILDVPRFYGPAGSLLAADPWLCMWILSWDTHALATAPTRLFDANIFHPAPLTLALSEHLLGYWPLFAPIYALTANPVLAYDATLLLSFALSGAAMCWLVRHWTGSLPAGLVGGLVFAFAPWRLSQLAHVQLLGLYGLPLVLLFWDRALADGRASDLAALAGAFFLQCLCSYYLAYCTVIVIGVYATVTAIGARVARLVAAAAAVGVGAAAFAVVSLPYLWVRSLGLLPEQGLAAQLALGVPSWRAYVVPLAIGPAIRPFQGRVALLLAAAGLAAVALRHRAPRPRAATVVALVAILATGYLLALGPGGGALFGLLWRWLPGFSATRVPARFVIVVAFAVAGLAGLGWGTLTRRLPPGLCCVVTVILVVVMVRDLGLGGFVVPVAATPPLSPAYAWLAEHGDGKPLLELPVRGWVGDLLGAFREQRYAYASTRHWLPQLTGRSGYVPPSYELLMPLARRLPDPSALRSLVDLTGLGWIVLHGTAPGWELAPGTELAASFGTERIYRVTLAGDESRRDDLNRRLRGEPEATTLAGVPLRRLAARDLRATVVRFDVPIRMVPGALLPVRLVLENHGRRAWPGLALGTDRLVRVRVAWRGPDGRRVRPALTPLRLPADTAPGARVEIAAGLSAPPAAGRFHFVARVAQGDGGVVGTRVSRWVEVVAP